MPYIKQERRETIPDITPIEWYAGDVNYFFTNTIKNYISVKGESYQLYNDIIGALECCKLELYRRKIAFYEDYKRAENGDVW